MVSQAASCAGAWGCRHIPEPWRCPLQGQLNASCSPLPAVPNLGLWVCIHLPSWGRAGTTQSLPGKALGTRVCILGTKHGLVRCTGLNRTSWLGEEGGFWRTRVCNIFLIPALPTGLLQDHLAAWVPMSACLHLHSDAHPHSSSPSLCILCNVGTA